MKWICRLTASWVWDLWLEMRILVDLRKQFKLKAIPHLKVIWHIFYVVLKKASMSIQLLIDNFFTWQSCQVKIKWISNADIPSSKLKCGNFSSYLQSGIKIFLFIKKNQFNWNSNNNLKYSRFFLHIKSDTNRDSIYLHKIYRIQISNKLHKVFEWWRDKIHKVVKKCN